MKHMILVFALAAAGLAVAQEPELVAQARAAGIDSAEEQARSAEAQQRVEAARQRAEEAKERDRERAEEAKQSELERAEEAKQRAEEARERVEEAKERAEDRYDRGSDALEERRWEKAISAFQGVPADSPRADGALYWTAYAQNKLGRRDQALATIAELRKRYAQSRWLNDAKALEMEVRQAQGQPVRPEAQEDEDLKLMALNSLMNADPEQAVPMLEKVLNGPQSPRLKERALFVLAQSGSPKARQVCIDIAKGKGNPDLQRKAVRYLGMFGGKDSRDALADIYRSSTDPAVKRQVIDAWFLGGDYARIGELAKQEKDADLRRQAIQKLGLMGKRTAGDLATIYASETNRDLKRAVLNAYFLQGNAPSLIAVARKESDPELKKEAVSKLALMHSKEATDFMMEILNK